MDGKFEAGRLEHVEGQRVQVDNPKKAEWMADTERIGRGWADHYEEYLRDSEAYGRKYQEDAVRGGEHVLTGFDNLRQLGVPPEYMREQAEVEAERMGALYDYMQEVKEKPLGALDAEVLIFWVQEISARLKQRWHAAGAEVGEKGVSFLKGFAESPEYQRNAVAERLAWTKRAAASEELRRRGLHPMIEPPDVRLPKVDR